MRRFDKFRTRLLSSLRKQRTPRNSTSSTESSARNRRRESTSERGTIDAGSSSPQQNPQQQQLHWSEARRIYSEPATREMKVDRGSSGRESSSTCSSSNLAPSVAHGASSGSEKIKGKRRRNHGDTQTLYRSCEDGSGAVRDREDSLADSQCGESDGEDDDNDDVFLESWEEVAAAAFSATNDRTATNLSSSSGIGSLRDNITSAASSSCNYFNPNSPQSFTSTSPLSVEELQRHSVCSAGVAGHGSAVVTIATLQAQNPTAAELGMGMGREKSGWEEWKIPSSEISLGAVLHQSQMETIYRGYWHGVVHVHTRSIHEVVDVVRFLDEIATLNCIRHENIQLFMGASLDMQCGTVALVMSELKGSTLSTRLHKLGHNFTAPSKTKILRQIAEGMEYLHAKGIPHGLLTSSYITLHHRVCISLAPPHTRHAHYYFHPHHLTYLPPECVRQLHVVQCSSPSPVSPTPTTVQPGETSTRLTSLGSMNCLTYERSGASRLRAPSSPSLVAMAMGGGGSSKLWGKRGSESCASANTYDEQCCHMVGSQLKIKMPPTAAADVFAFGTVVYELMSLEQPYKHLPAECVIWQVGQGKTQSVTLLPKGRFRNIINSCWRENPQKRPSFTQLLVTLEETVVPISSKSVSCSSSSRLKPSHSLPSLNSASLPPPTNHFPN